jgi:hypothetical protein
MNSRLAGNNSFYNLTLYIRDDNNSKKNLHVRVALVWILVYYVMRKDTIRHLFFIAVWPRLIWENISEICGKDLGTNFESVGKYWLK